MSGALADVTRRPVFWAARLVGQKTSKRRPCSGRCLGAKVVRLKTCWKNQSAAQIRIVKTCWKNICLFCKMIETCFFNVFPHVFSTFFQNAFLGDKVVFSTGFRGDVFVRFSTIFSTGFSTGFSTVFSTVFSTICSTVFSTFFQRVFKSWA